MNFKKFADLMEEIGFKDNEPIAPVFTLNQKDLKSDIFKKRYFKVAGLYRIVSMWAQGDEVAFWAKVTSNETKLFPFSKEEVDYLAKKNKFRKK
ncbi:MAG: hypothetical protein AAB522_03140 [Patescibacteria group bacterium]